MAEKPLLVLAVEHALDGPTRWVRYTPGPAARFAAPPRREAVSRSSFALVPPQEDLPDTPPLVAAVEEALGATVETLRYLPAIPPAAPAPAKPLEPAAVASVPRPESANIDDDELVAAIEAAVAHAVLWVQYAPTTGDMQHISRQVA